MLCQHFWVCYFSICPYQQKNYAGLSVSFLTVVQESLDCVSITVKGLKTFRRDLENKLTGRGTRPRFSHTHSYLTCCPVQRPVFLLGGTLHYTSVCPTGTLLEEQCKHRVWKCFFFPSQEQLWSNFRCFGGGEGRVKPKEQESLDEKDLVGQLAGVIRWLMDYVCKCPPLPKSSLHRLCLHWSLPQTSRWTSQPLKRHLG